MSVVASFSGLSLMRGSRKVLDDVSLRIAAGEVVGLIGPNGAGKTTLMRAALGLIDAQGRSSLREMGATARARHCAYLPQAREIAWGMSVRDVVMLGRLPHGGAETEADRAAVARAIEAQCLSEMATRSAAELSGGEQARVLLARALAQDTALVMADEPVAGLDPAHQISTMQQFRALAAQGQAVLVSLHDLGLAARFCDRVVVMARGRVVASGPPAEVLDEDCLARVFSVRALRFETPEGLLLQPVALA